MSEAIYEIALDLHSTMSQASLSVKQGDTDRKVYISLREDGKPYRIERGAFAVFSTITPEGKVIEDNCIVEDNKIVYGFTEALTASVGVMDVEIRLYDVNSKHIISPVFTLIVDPRAAVGDKVKEATDSFTSLDGMYNKLNAVANEVQTKLDNGEFVGETGAAAGFGAVTAQAVSLSPGTPPTVSIETSGPDTAKNFKFSFGIPESGVRKSEAASAIPGNASGSVVALTDISPLEHTLGIKARGKNLLDLSKCTLNNCTLNANVNGITSNIQNGYFCGIRVEYLNDFLMVSKGETFTFSTSSPMASDKSMTVVVWGKFPDSRIVQEVNGERGGNSVSITIDKDFLSISYVELRLNRDNKTTHTDTTSVFANLQFEEGTATSFTPHIADITTAKLQRYGGNILPYPYYSGSTTYRGVTFTDNGDGSITANGIATGDLTYWVAHPYDENILYPGTYTASLKVNKITNNVNATDGDFTLMVYRYSESQVAEEKLFGKTAYSKHSLTFTNDKRGYLVIRFYVYSGTVFDNVTFSVQLEKGTEATPFEPYTEPTIYPINADGTVDGVTSLYPTTTLIPDTEGIVLDVNYNVDTKKYIDNKFAELAALIVNS